MKHIDLDSPVKGREYWVIRYTQDLDPDYPIDQNDLYTAIYLSDGLWRGDPHTTFKSPHYMEVPTI